MFDSKIEASAYESIIACEYGIPTALFEQREGYVQELVERIFGGINLGALYWRAADCLNRHGRLIDKPLLTPGDGVKCGNRTSMSVEACNLLPGLMMVASHSGDREKSCKWLAVESVDRSKYHGYVYSLNVEPHHLYISDGLVTCNCLYSWRGADSTVLSRSDIPPENWRVLSQSYRVPRAVHDIAVQTIHKCDNREPVEYKPADKPGQVERRTAGYKQIESYLPLIEEALDAGRRIMILTSCEYMLAPVTKRLRAEGIPYHNPYCGRWSPLAPSAGVSMAHRILAYKKASPSPWEFTDPEPWTMGDLKLWAPKLRSKGLLLRGAKKRIEEWPEEQEHEPAWGHLYDLFEREVIDDLCEGDLDWLRTRMVVASQRAAEFPVRVAKRFGVSTLEEDPRVIVGTVHSVKGGEAEDVILFPDLSMAGYKSLQRRGWASRDAVSTLR